MAGRSSHCPGPAQEVVAPMQDASSQSEARAELLDRLRHALQYAWESELKMMDALRLLEAGADNDV